MYGRRVAGIGYLCIFKFLLYECVRLSRHITTKGRGEGEREREK